MVIPDFIRRPVHILYHQSPDGQLEPEGTGVILGYRVSTDLYVRVS